MKNIAPLIAELDRQHAMIVDTLETAETLDYILEQIQDLVDEDGRVNTRLARRLHREFVEDGSHE